MVAQATQFFVAGFETSSSTITFALYELAKNQQVQNKLREDIKNVYAKYGKFTYECLKEMNYLEMVVQGELPHKIKIHLF